MISADTFGQLRRLGESQGLLRVEDIERVTPLDDLNAEELAHLFDQLEDAGIQVEIDPTFFAHRPGSLLPNFVRRDAERADRGVPASPSAPSNYVLQPDTTPSRSASSKSRRPSTTTVGAFMLAALALLVLAAVVANSFF
jgi:hypothetical protein